MTERKPPPTGVVIGPFSATPVSRIASSTSGGSGLPPYLSMTSAPASLDVPVELDAGRLEDAARRLGQLGAGPVAGNEDDAVRHGAGMYLRAR